MISSCLGTQGTPLGDLPVHYESRRKQPGCFGEYHFFPRLHVPDFSHFTLRPALARIRRPFVWDQIIFSRLNNKDEHIVANLACLIFCDARMGD